MEQASAATGSETATSPAWPGRLGLATIVEEDVSSMLAAGRTSGLAVEVGEAVSLTDAFDFCTWRSRAQLIELP